MRAVRAPAMQARRKAQAQEQREGMVVATVQSVSRQKSLAQAERVRFGSSEVRERQATRA